MTRESSYQKCEDDPLCTNLIPQGGFSSNYKSKSGDDTFEVKIDQRYVFKGEEYKISSSLEGSLINLNQQEINSATTNNRGVLITRSNGELTLVIGDKGVPVSSITMPNNNPNISVASSSGLKEGQANLSFKLKIGNKSFSGATDVYSIKDQINDNCNQCWGGW